MNSFADIAESRIQEALDQGAFDSLPGMGQPLDLEAYFASPASLRAGLAMLKSAGAIPPEVEALREIQQLQQRLEVTTDADLKKNLQQELQTRQTELNMALERIKRTLRLDSTHG